MDQSQQQRLQILSRLLEGRLTTAEAATSLGISVRQMERVRARFRREGASSLVHGNRGRQPSNRWSDELREEVVEFARGLYAGHSYEYLAEMLAEEQEITLSADSVRRICLEGGVPSPVRQRRRAPRRQRRQRSERVGDMIQMDGSPHPWLDDRGPRLTLLNAIDDATGHKWSRFFEAETLEGYMTLLRQLIRQCGVPGIVYVDGISTARGPSRFRPTAEVPDTTSQQLRRALQELGSSCIVARSAQAKGRVERTHGTDQGRLVSFLRRHRAASLEEANQLLPNYLRQFNRRFTVPPQNPEPGWLPRPHLHLDDILCLKEERVVSRDNTVRVYGRTIDIPAGSPQRDYAGLRVNIHRRFDGSIAVFLADRRIAGSQATFTSSAPTESLRD